MPRASWNGFLRLSLVACPIYLSLETSEVKRIAPQPSARRAVPKLMYSALNAGAVSE